MSSIPPQVPHYQLYTDQLIRIGNGIPLWHPTPSIPEGISIGDVGFINRGRFHLLLRSTCSTEELGSNVPSGFAPLILSTSDLTTVTRKPQPLHTRSISVAYGGDVDASVNTPVTLTPGASVCFQLSRDQGAAFLTRHDTQCIDTDQDGLMEEYIKTHYNAWVDLARDRGYGRVNPILVSGVDFSQDFAMFAYSTANDRVPTTLTADIPPITSTWAGLWARWSSSGPACCNWGPTENSTGQVDNLTPISQADTASTRTRNAHITFIRGWMMKERAALFPALAKAGAEPQDFHDKNSDQDSCAIAASNTPEEADHFNHVFRYMFENCAADVALLHVKDLNSIFQTASNPEDNIQIILEKCRPQVEVESGVATLTKGNNKRNRDTPDHAPGPIPKDAPILQTRPMTSHVMKTTTCGRPFLRNIFDLFGTLIVSLELKSHDTLFRSFPNSFTTDEVVQNLASLKFSQSNRGPDPRRPSRIVTTTTTTTFTMTRDMAKALNQNFMDARLVENAANPSSTVFKDRGIYVLTPKGLHVLERFISKNGIDADHLSHVFQTQPICAMLLHLERGSVDDEIVFSQSVVTSMFRRFAGRQPNYLPDNFRTLNACRAYQERSKGVPLMDVTEPQSILSRATSSVQKYCFTAISALNWLCDFTSVIGEEATEVASKFVQFGLITLISEKRKNDSVSFFSGRSSSPACSTEQQGEFRSTSKAIYRITEEGRRLARWDGSIYEGTPSSSSASLSTTTQDDATSIDNSGSKIRKMISTPERLNQVALEKKTVKESNMARLRYIIEEPTLRSKFREFLRDNFSEENLSFWLDVQDFKRKFNVTSSAMASTEPQLSTPNSSAGQIAMERHHESLIYIAFEIYNTYLAPSGTRELNIDHGLRNEISVYLGHVIRGLTGQVFQGYVKPEHARTFNATQLQTMIRLYERVQTRVFRLMATDSVPKFIKTLTFLSLRNWADEFDLQDSEPPLSPGLKESEEVGGTFITISQQASERAPQPRTGSGERVMS